MRRQFARKEHEQSVEAASLQIILIDSGNVIVGLKRIVGQLIVRNDIECYFTLQLIHQFGPLKAPSVIEE